MTCKRLKTSKCILIFWKYCYVEEKKENLGEFELVFPPLSKIISKTITNIHGFSHSWNPTPVRYIPYVVKEKVRLQTLYLTLITRFYYSHWTSEIIVS